MVYKDFHPFGTAYIKVEFKCKVCKEAVMSEELGLPHPNYMAERASDSHNTTSRYMVCENCEEEYSVDISVGYSDAYIEIMELDDDTDIKIIEIPEEYIDEQIDTFLQSEDVLTMFQEEIDKLKKLNNIDLQDVELQYVLRRQIYSGVITCLEDYLSTTLIKNVLNDKMLFRKFVETYENIKNRKFSLNEIYKNLDKLEQIVKGELLDIIYHHLPKVRNIYGNVFGIKFPKIEEVMTIVNNRHHMVHRNGKDKEGNALSLGKEEVDRVIDIVEDFIKEIDEQISNPF